MTENTLTVRFFRLLLKKDPLNEIYKLYETAIHSKSLNIEAEPADSDRLPIIIYYAILSELTARARPASKADVLESEKLQRLL